MSPSLLKRMPFWRAYKQRYKPIVTITIAIHVQCSIVHLACLRIRSHAVYRLLQWLVDKTEKSEDPSSAGKEDKEKEKTKEGEEHGKEEAKDQESQEKEIEELKKTGNDKAPKTALIRLPKDSLPLYRKKKKGWESLPLYAFCYP